ncbi:hypothetical protein NX059_003198 [Plenodomus lindquistii]|nr:hypothetical protein NX059_003198 [Plenodomus lindquistii]
MDDSIPAEEQANYEIFRECMSEAVLRLLAAPTEDRKKTKSRRHLRKASKTKTSVVAQDMRPGAQSRATATSQETSQTTDAEDLGDFIDYLSTLIFPSLPPPLRTLTHTLYTSTPTLQDTYSLPLTPSTISPLLPLIPPPALDTLTSSALLPTPPDPPSLSALLNPILTAYITHTTSPPPLWSTTRTSACELCARDWIPLTYHHLIPKSVHAKVRKRGWHDESRLGSVAWLCRACHSFVHGLRGNEELARGFYSVELIFEGGVEGDQEVRRRVEGWVRWVGGVRWRKR